MCSKILLLDSRRTETNRQEKGRHRQREMGCDVGESKIRTKRRQGQFRDKKGLRSGFENLATDCGLAYVIN